MDFLKRPAYLCGFPLCTSVSSVVRFLRDFYTTGDKAYSVSFSSVVTCHPFFAFTTFTVTVAGASL